MHRHNLRAFRKRAGLTLEEAASEAGITQSTLSRIERGEVPYGQYLLETLARVYGTTPAALIDIAPALTAEELALIERFRVMGPEDRAKALRILEAFAPQGATPNAAPPALHESTPNPADPVRTPTVAERQLLDALRGTLPQYNWRFGHRIDTGDGEADFVLGIAAPDHALAIEVLPPRATGFARQMADNRRRTLQRAGWRVLDITPKEVRDDLPGLVEMVSGFVTRG